MNKWVILYNKDKKDVLLTTQGNWELEDYSGYTNLKTSSDYNECVYALWDFYVNLGIL